LTHDTKHIKGKSQSITTFLQNRDLASTVPEISLNKRGWQMLNLLKVAYKYIFFISSWSSPFLLLISQSEFWENFNLPFLSKERHS
jgi:hypothetical protein